MPSIGFSQMSDHLGTQAETTHNCPMLLILLKMDVLFLLIVWKLKTTMHLNLWIIDTTINDHRRYSFFQSHCQLAHNMLY